MKVRVEHNEFRNWPEPVQVVVRNRRGEVVWCNHVRTIHVEADFGSIDELTDKWVGRTLSIEACKSCPAWRKPGEEWFT